MSRSLAFKFFEGLDGGNVLLSAERVHRQLRPGMPSDYASVLRDVFDGGGQIVVAFSEGEVVGLALFRWLRTPRCGIRFYVDDMVVDEPLRSQGIGAALMRVLEDVAREGGARAIELESGTARHDTHRFYEREGFERFAISFRKPT